MEVVMNQYIPFIHKIEKKKEELQPLYIELYPPPPIEVEEEKEEQSSIIIIQLWLFNRRQVF